MTKICFKYKKNLLTKYQIDIIKEFITQLQQNMPLFGKLTIHFLEERKGKMTTGSYKDKDKYIKVLFKGRMLADVMRTLSHEWAHCYDHEHIGIEDRRDVGGESENFANAKSGEETKKFIKSNKDLENKIFSTD
jgi:hypothetical protein